MIREEKDKGRGVKEKKKVDGGAHGDVSGADQMSTKVDNVGMDGDEFLSPTKVNHGNSAMNKEDIMHDENEGLTPNPSGSGRIIGLIPNFNHLMTSLTS
nr:hypothetical protein [Tanacetum cinerariifolium]